MASITQTTFSTTFFVWKILIQHLMNFALLLTYSTKLLFQCCIDNKANKWYNNFAYGQTSNINHTLVDNKIVDHSDVVGSPVGAAPTSSSFST